MDVGDVVRAMKADSTKRFARKGWNGRGIYIMLQVPDEHSKMTLPYVYIETNGLQGDNPDAPRGRCPWLASQTDLLAEDYFEVKTSDMTFGDVINALLKDHSKMFARRSDLRYALYLKENGDERYSLYLTTADGQGYFTGFYCNYVEDCGCGDMLADDWVEVRIENKELVIV